jgi:hypothetical protein
LLVKTLVSRGDYKLTDSDIAQINCFEELASTPNFIAPPGDQKGDDDSHWRRLLVQHHHQKRLDELKNDVRKALGERSAIGNGSK